MPKKEGGGNVRHISEKKKGGVEEMVTPTKPILGRTSAL